MVSDQRVFPEKLHSGSHTGTTCTDILFFCSMHKWFIQVRHFCFVMVVFFSLQVKKNIWSLWETLWTHTKINFLLLFPFLQQSVPEQALPLLQRGDVIYSVLKELHRHELWCNLSHTSAQLRISVAHLSYLTWLLKSSIIWDLLKYKIYYFTEKCLNLSLYHDHLWVFICLTLCLCFVIFLRKILLCLTYIDVNSLFTAKRAKSYSSLMNIQDKLNWKAQRRSLLLKDFTSRLSLASWVWGLTDLKSILAGSFLWAVAPKSFFLTLQLNWNTLDVLMDFGTLNGCVHILRPSAYNVVNGVWTHEVKICRMQIGKTNKKNTCLSRPFTASFVFEFFLQF